MAPEAGGAREPVRVLFCGDRPVAALLAHHMVSNGAAIVGLGLNPHPLPTLAAALRDAAGTDPARVFSGPAIWAPRALECLAEQAPELGVSCGFSGILPRRLLELPRRGWVNIHRSYLPQNRGLLPLQWALVDRTPMGVTLHVMTDRVDAGPIIARRRLEVSLTDNGATLAERADQLAYELFREWWPALRSGEVESSPQDEAQATYHSLTQCRDLNRLHLDATMTVRQTLDILRGFSGPRTGGAVVESDGHRYAIQVSVMRIGDE